MEEQAVGLITALDYITIGISFLALLSSLFIGIKQTSISQMQVKMQNKVELYLLAQPIVFRDAIRKEDDRKVPAMYIRNIGTNVVYLENYLFNGREYPLGKEVLPPVASYNAFRYILLPTDGSTHVSFEINFRDWCNNPWKTKGFADYREHLWEITYSPCEKRTEK